MSALRMGELNSMIIRLSVNVYLDQMYRATEAKVNGCTAASVLRHRCGNAEARR